MIKIVVLGSGNIGTQLCIAFEKNASVLLLQNYNRKGLPISNCNVPFTKNKNDILAADVYFCCFNDASLVNFHDNFSFLKGIIVHTSGATPIEVFHKFKRHGVFYPAQSINKSISVNFEEIPIIIEANTKEDEALLKILAKSISKKIYLLNSEQRNGLHIAAVFANNFSNFMYTQAKSICKDFKIDFNLLQPLITDTITKLEWASPEDIQTGPAIRNDSVTIKKHINTLQNNEQIKLYELLTTSIQKHYGKKL